MSEAAALRYRIHPRTAWTAERQNLGGAPQELFGTEESVAAVRLPEGWPLVIQGPPAMVWHDLAAAGEDGCTAHDLASPWVTHDTDIDTVIEDLAGVLHRWSIEGLVEICVPDDGSHPPRH